MLIFCTLAINGAEKWSDWTSIDTLYPATSGYIFNTTNYRDKDNSGGDDGSRFMIKLVCDNYEGLVATLLLAYALDYKIQFCYNEGPVTSAPVIIRFKVDKNI